jgi:hypothetical protein
MANKHKGEVEFDLKGKKLTLVFDWDAIDQILETLGEDGLRDVVRKPTPKRVTLALLAGLKKHHPEVTAEEIRAANPPLMVTSLLIDRGIAYAYFGTETPPESQEKPEGEIAEKKTP